MRMLFALALIVGPALMPAYAGGCPTPVDVRVEMQILIERANAAPNYQVGRKVSDEMWKVWLRAPDEAAQAVLDRGMSRRDSYDFQGAFQEFTRLTEYCPDYAEGWNQRAYINYLREEYQAALEDLDRALALQPRHIAAQSGRGLTLMHMGRTAEAREQMLAAVANNPWLSEAALLEKGAPLGPLGEDI